MPALSLFSRQFFPYFCTQALGAFNDNVFKNLVVLVLVYGHIQDNMGLSAGFLSNVVGALFIAPFVLFSGLAGLWCTQLETARWIRLLKWFELLIMLGAALGFYWQSTPMLLASVFLMGLHSALFGPVKYAYLPERLASKHLIKANAWVEASTFLAIVLGTLFAGTLLALNPQPQWLGLSVLAFAALGVWAAHSVPTQRVPTQEGPAQTSTQTSLHPTAHHLAWPTPGLLWRSTQAARHAAKAVPSVYLSVLGISSFWCVGSIVLGNLPVLAQQTLCLNEAALSWLLAVFAIGVAMGSILAHVFSSKHVELGLVPLASIGLGLGLVALYISLSNPAPCGPTASALLDNPQSLWVGGCLLLCGVFGGLYAVPLYTWVQLQTPSHNMGRVIAYNNIQNALFMVLGALLCLGLLALGAKVEHTLLLALGINILANAIIFKTIPEFLMTK